MCTKRFSHEIEHTVAPEKGWLQECFPFEDFLRLVPPGSIWSNILNLSPSNSGVLFYGPFNYHVSLAV